MRHSLYTVLGLVGVLALVAAMSMVWLVVEQPVTLADAVSTGQYRPLFARLAQELDALVRALARLM